MPKGFFGGASEETECEIAAMEKRVKKLARDLEVLEVQDTALSRRFEELKK